MWRTLDFESDLECSSTLCSWGKFQLLGLHKYVGIYVFHQGNDFSESLRLAAISPSRLVHLVWMVYCGSNRLSFVAMMSGMLLGFEHCFFFGCFPRQPHPNWN